MNTHPIFGQMITGMMEAQRLAAPGMEPPRPSGCPSCAAAEAQCDRMAQRIRELEAEVCDAAFAGHMIGAERAQERIRELEAALDLEARARVAAAEIAHEAKMAQANAEGDATAMLMLLAQIREAVGDNGRRMQGELVEYLRILYEEADPDRVSQLEAELRAQDYATPHDPSDAGAWGEDRFEAAS